MSPRSIETSGTLFDRVNRAVSKEDLEAITNDLKLKVFDKFDLTTDRYQFDFETKFPLKRGDLTEVYDTIVITLKGPWTYLSELHRDDVKLVDFNGKDHVYKSLVVSLDRDDKEYTCTIQL